MADGDRTLENNEIEDSSDMDQVDLAPNASNGEISDIGHETLNEDASITSEANPTISDTVDENTIEENQTISNVGEENSSEPAIVNEGYVTEQDDMNVGDQTECQEPTEEREENAIQDLDVNTGDTTSNKTPPPKYSDVITSTNGEVSRGNPDFIIESDVQNSPQEAENKKWYTIDRYMLPAKFTYFCDQFKEASLWPYLVLFQVSIGLSPAQAGIINGCRFIGCLFGAPIWGMIADQKNIHRQLIMIICACAVVFQCSQPFWGEKFGPTDVNSCPMQTNKTMREIELDHEKSNNNTLFLILLFVSITACFFDGTTLTFVDSGTQRRIRASKRKIDFGRSRLFGSIGYGIGSMVSSYAVKNFATVGITCYAGMFCVYFAISILLIINFNFLYRGVKPQEGEEDDNSEKPSVLTIIWKSMNFDVAFFLATVLFNGLMRALVFSFTFLYLKELGSPTWLLGVSMAFSQVASLIMYALSEKILEIAGGTWQVMCFSCFTWVIRLICLAYMKNYYLIFPINALNGVSASLFVASSIIHVRKTCAPAAYTAMYGIRNALFNGGGYILANIVGGELYEYYGPKRLFLYTCMICAGWVIVMIVYIVRDKCKNKASLVINNRVEDKRNDIALGDMNNERKTAAVA